MLVIDEYKKAVFLKGIQSHVNLFLGIDEFPVFKLISVKRLFSICRLNQTIKIFREFIVVFPVSVFIDFCDSLKYSFTMCDFMYILASIKIKKGPRYIIWSLLSVFK